MGLLISWPTLDVRTVCYFFPWSSSSPFHVDNVTYEDITGSTSHIIGKVNGTFQAFSDPRKFAGHGYAY